MRNEGKRRYAKIKSLIEIVIKNPVSSSFEFGGATVFIKVRKEIQF